MSRESRAAIVVRLAISPRTAGPRVDRRLTSCKMEGVVTRSAQSANRLTRLPGSRMVMTKPPTALNLAIVARSSTSHQTMGPDSKKITGRGLFQTSNLLQDLLIKKCTNSEKADQCSRANQVVYFYITISHFCMNYPKLQVLSTLGKHQNYGEGVGGVYWWIFLTKEKYNKDIFI